jgi:hypothetical protein
MLLHELSEELETEGIHGDLFLLGGAVKGFLPGPHPGAKSPDGMLRRPPAGAQ